MTPDPLDTGLELLRLSALFVLLLGAIFVGFFACWWGGILTAVRVWRTLAWFSRKWTRPVAAIAITGVLGFALPFTWYCYLDTTDLPDVSKLIQYAPPQIAHIYDSQGKVMIELGRTFRKPIEYRDIPLIVEQAHVAAEDKNFYGHKGVDWWVLPTRWLGGKGGSTLTMQLARNQYLMDWMEHERGSQLLVDNAITQWFAFYKSPGWVNRRLRKAREIKYALAIERSLDKQTLLARYLSTVYYGYSMYGPDSAARFFFNKPMEELTPDEAALMASFIPAPSRFAVLTKDRIVQAEQLRRRNAVLARMGEKKFLTTEFDCNPTLNTWWRWDRSVKGLGAVISTDLPRGDCRDDVAYYSAKPLFLVGRLPDGRTEAPASVQTALDEMEQRGFSDEKFFSGALQITTTNDLRIQRIVNRAAQTGRKIYEQHYGKKDVAPQMAIVVQRNSDGAILAQFGGYSDRDRNDWALLDRSRKSVRQPGSAFKPFVYLSAFRDNADRTPDTMVFDGGFYPVNMGGGAKHFVHNYDNATFPGGKGWLPFWEAFAQSRNVPAVRVAMEYTRLDGVLAVARLCGITTFLRHEPSTALGSNDVTLLELNNAFRAIISDGIVADPSIINRVSDPFDQTLWTTRRTTRPLQVPRSALWYTQMLLRSTVVLPSGTAHSLDTNRPRAQLLCKTGTTNNHADARIQCGTYGIHGITVGVWTGHDDSLRSLGNLAVGGRLALPVAREIFEGIYGDPAIIGKPPSVPDTIENPVQQYRNRVYPKKTTQ